MTEKQFTEKEVSKILTSVFEQYIQMFVDGRIEFTEYVIIENIMMKLNNEFNKLKYK